MTNTDALVSNTADVLLGVKTADCVPILLGDPVTHAFAAVHAGWRGTSGSILKHAIGALEREYGSRAEHLCAAIGPAANVCCYEVGSDVIDVFKERFPQAGQLFQPTRDGHARIDLQTANRNQLIDAGDPPIEFTWRRSAPWIETISSFPIGKRSICMGAWAASCLLLELPASNRPSLIRGETRFAITEIGRRRRYRINRNSLTAEHQSSRQLIVQSLLLLAECDHYETDCQDYA